ncbi:MAG: hypothetical protein LPK00_12675 [Bacillaceae bacterium]|nr:hypothetical protein [Bacillaceae bacterium]
MHKGTLYFFTKPDPNRPIENKYVTEINGDRNSFMNKDDAFLYLFVNGVKEFKYLTKELDEYKNTDKTISYEFMHIENRVGYVIYDFEPFIDENNKMQKRKAYVWRFIGFGRSCFAISKDELKRKVINLLEQYKLEGETKGYYKYPFYTRHYREKSNSI